MAIWDLRHESSMLFLQGMFTIKIEMRDLSY